MKICKIIIKMITITVPLLLVVIVVYAILNYPDSDLDGDNDVDGADLTLFAFVFGKSVVKGDFVLGDRSDADRADLDNDGDVDGADLTLFASDFGKLVEMMIDGSLTIATLRDDYGIHEKVELTDPPFSYTGFGAKIQPNTNNKMTELVLSPYGERVVEREIEENDGFIIQFEEEPLLAKEIDLKKNVEENERSVLRPAYKLFAQVLPRDLEPSLGSNVDLKLKAYKDMLVNKREIAKKDIIERLRQTNMVTGKAFEGSEEYNIIQEYAYIFNGVVLDISEEEAEEVKKSRYVKEVYPNYKVHTLLNESVPVIKANKAYEYFGVSGDGVTIAVIDTGIDPTHKSLDDLDDDKDTGDPKIIAFKDFVNFRLDPYDDNGHGTHCAGIAAGTGGNSQYVGVAPKANLVGVKVLNDWGSGTFSQVIAGIEWAVQNKNRYGIDIISMSLGASVNSDGTTPIEQAADLAVDAGINFVVAAGNSGVLGQNTVGIPACAKKVITVGAVDNDMEIAYFSSRGPTKDGRIKPEVSAPGVDVCSAQWNDAWEDRECEDPDFVHISGTSMATPHVAGVAALLLEANPSLNPSELRELLMNTAIDRGKPGADNAYGWGVVDALEALIKVKPPEHDIGVYNLNIPKWTELNNHIQINANLRNNGLNDEANIRMVLLVDGVEQDTKINLVAVGNSIPVSFSFTPNEAKTYNIALEVEQVDGENIVSNNKVTDRVRVVSVAGTINAVVVDSWGNDKSQYTIFDELNENWYLYGDYILNIDYTTLNKEDITYEDISATNADVLILSDAWDDGSWTGYNWEYTDDEINAIKQYIKEGHGLVGTSGTLSTEYAQNNMKLAPLFGLDENSAASWADFFDGEFDIIANDTTLLNGISDPYKSGQDMTTIGLVIGNMLPVTMVAKSSNEEAFISAYKSSLGASVYFTHIIELDNNANEADKQFFYNSLLWTKISSAQQTHDIAAYDLKLSERIRVNEIMHFNASIKNNGVSDETDIEVALLVDGIEQDRIKINSIAVGSLVSISFSFTPIEVKSYDIAIVVDKLVEENIILNNYIGARIVVPKAAFNDVYSDYGIDINDDGLHDYLAIDIGVDVYEAGSYNIELGLSSSFGAEITSGYNYTDLKEGTSSITVLLDGVAIRKFGLDGPYKLKNLILYDNIHEKIDSREETYTTSAYSYSEFESNSDINILNFLVPDRVIVNNSIDIEVEIENIGTEVARNVTAELYEMRLGEEKQYLIGYNSLGNLSVGFSKEINFQVIPNKVGYTEFKLVVNSTNDYNVNNNIRHNVIEVIPNAPDVTGYIEWIDKLLVNQSATIGAVVENRGAKTAQNVKAELYERKWENGREVFYLIGMVDVKDLDADDKEQIIFTWTPTEVGNKDLRLIVSCIDDGNLDNNIDYRGINVIPNAPDITGYIEGVDRLVVDQLTDIKVIIINEGFQTAQNVKAELYERRWENGEELLKLVGIVYVRDLGVDDREQIIFNWTPTEVGYNELNLVVNCTNDGNLDNNLYYSEIYVVPNGPDVEGMIYWERLIVNQSNKIKVSIRNIGIKEAQNTKASLYRVEWTEQGENLTLIGAEDIGNLDVDKFVEREFNYLPDKIGYLNLKLIVNCSDDQNLKNNVYNSAIKVMLDAPDVGVYLQSIVDNIVINKDNKIGSWVQNEGTKQAENTILSLYEIKIQNGREIFNLIETKIMGVLEVDKEVYHEFNYKPSKIGRYELELLVDCTNDTDLENNVRRRYVNVVPQSSIENTGTIDLTGYLIITVQRQNSNNNWVDFSVILNETVNRVVRPKEKIALDKVWADNGYYIPNEAGEFRVYAAFRNEDGDVIRVDDGTYLNDTYEFRVW